MKTISLSLYIYIWSRVQGQWTPPPPPPPRYTPRLTSPLRDLFFSLLPEPLQRAPGLGA